MEIITMIMSTLFRLVLRISDDKGTADSIWAGL